jgi:hypothetical protein
MATRTTATQGRATTDRAPHRPRPRPRRPPHHRHGTPRVRKRKRPPRPTRIRNSNHATCPDKATAESHEARAPSRSTEARPPSRRRAQTTLEHRRLETKASTLSLRGAVASCGRAPRHTRRRGVVHRASLVVERLSRNEKLERSQKRRMGGHIRFALLSPSPHVPTIPVLEPIRITTGITTRGGTSVRESPVTSKCPASLESATRFAGLPGSLPAWRTRLPRRCPGAGAAMASHGGWTRPAAAAKASA